MTSLRLSPFAGLLLLVPLSVGAQNGAELYARTCLVCHGADGTGVMPGVRDLTAVDGPLNKADAALLRSIRDGVPGTDGALSMPPRGGDPQLTEEDIHQLIDYLRQEFGQSGIAAQTNLGEDQ